MAIIHFSTESQKRLLGCYQNIGTTSENEGTQHQEPQHKTYDMNVTNLLL
jgi:hypothetical protein